MLRHTGIFLSGFRKLCAFLTADFRHPWGGIPHALPVALLAFAVSSPALAEEILASRAETHLALGPQVSAIHYDSEWDSEVGAELHLARIRKSALLGVVGGSLGVATFGQEEQIQLNLDLYAGSRALTQLPIGVSFGPMLNVFPNGRPQVGARATLWAYYGVMPYLSVAWLSGPNAPADPSVEIGLKIPFSIWKW